MTQIICCIKKDLLEVIRNRRALLFNGLLIAVTVMVLGTTLAFPSLIDLLVEKGVLIEYSFNIVATVYDQLLGQAKLELGIVAPQELRKITTVIGLKNS